MRIAQVAPLAESVPPKLYGGTERVRRSQFLLPSAVVPRWREVTSYFPPFLLLQSQW
jgi:hypothetical protein